MFSIESFNINYDFPEELVEIAESIPAQSATPIKKKYKSVYDYVAIIYYFRFVEKLENSIIAKKLNYYNTNFHNKLTNLRWNFSNDYIENKKLYNEMLKQLDLVLEKAKCEIKKRNIRKLKKFRNIISGINLKKIHSKAYKKLGLSTAEEYIMILYYLVHLREERLTTGELCIMFDLSLEGIQHKLSRYGLSLSHSEGIERKKNRKRQNYENTVRNGKSSRAKSQAENFNDGSVNENYFRTLLSLKIYDYLPSYKYDIVVGVNTTGILQAKSIDIPLMIYDVEYAKLYRFVLEYNGEPYHMDDSIKISLAIQRGWTYIPIFERQNDSSSNNKKILERKVHGLCEYIKDYIARDNLSSSITPDK